MKNEMKSVRYKLDGVAPLIVHNGSLADPMNPIVQAMKRETCLRKKTDETHIEIARLEFLGSLYLENNIPVIPGEAIEAMLISASGVQKAKAIFKAGMFCEGSFPIEYDGPTDPDGLWADKRFVSTVGARVMKARIMRTRPIFKNWSITVEVSYFPSVISESQITSAMEHAGTFIGLCDWRPRYGRFEAKKIGG
jgi:hypothetical protein